ncbi:MAG: DNA-binding protein [Chloroflexi bacterium]|nr:DNA-binding protein [Chloroflexota bacterium]
MKAKQLASDGALTYALIFEIGDEVMRGIHEFARREGLTAAHFTAIGAFSDALLGYFDWERKDYRKIPVGEQVEVLSLVGDVALLSGDPKVHAHVVVGYASGAAAGGHLLEAHVRPTLEVVLTETPAHLRRVFNEAAQLPLITLE